jgi:hypothetical protein
MQKGFSYTPDLDASPSTTAGALLVLYLTDQQDRPEVAPAAQFLIDKPIREDYRYYYYALYYTTQAAFQAGQPAWPAVWKNNSEQLLKLQRKDDGSWPEKAPEPGGGDKKGRFYATAMSVLTLSIPLRLLPLYQK